MIRIFYNENDEVLTSQQWIDDTKAPKIEKIFYKDIFEKNDMIKNIRIEKGKVIYNLSEKQINYKEAYEQEILNDLINGGVIY